VINSFKDVILSVDDTCTKRDELVILQVNLGNRCNQQCLHCHVDASPDGNRIMSTQIMDDIIKFLSKKRGLILDVTGGCPELNPNFRYLIEKAKPYVKQVMIRTNLTIMFENNMEYLPNFYKKNKVKLVCSMPCYTKKNVDSQRGNGVFDKSIKALKLLNTIGYGKVDSLQLDLVYNPGGAFLPADQRTLERDFKRNLKENFGIVFNHLLTITNAPINRFERYLKINGNFDEYMKLLIENFNKDIAKQIMCRSLLSVGWDGKIYDCDFNQALGLTIKDKFGKLIYINEIEPQDLEGKEIIFRNHCFCCTAGTGSSCHGALDRKAEILQQVVPKKELDIDKTRQIVGEYYSKVLSTRSDLKTGACCAIEKIPSYLQNILNLIEPEIIEKFYGCGSTIPLELDGRAVLDLGCGTGRDAYIISYLAGEDGRIVGVDMSEEQLGIARKYTDIHMKKFGFQKTNIEFIKGYIEELKLIGLKNNSFDVVVSNCVVNLSPRKDLVLFEVHRLLKQGGEFFFSDIFADRRLPKWAKDDPILVGECLGGALYWKDFERLAAKAGFVDCRVYARRNIELYDNEIKNRIGFANFYSITYRLFKIDDLEDACEDYGQVAVYLGTLKEQPHEFILDEHHIFIKGKPTLVCGNTADILQRSRFCKHFKVVGNKNIHYGLFDCRPAAEIKYKDFSDGGVCC
jgi:radical SAM/Cys-rich protein